MTWGAPRVGHNALGAGRLYPQEQELVNEAIRIGLRRPRLAVSCRYCFNTMAQCHRPDSRTENVRSHIKHLEQCSTTSPSRINCRGLRWPPRRGCGRKHPHSNTSQVGGPVKTSESKLTSITALQAVSRRREHHHGSLREQLDMVALGGRPMWPGIFLQ